MLKFQAFVPQLPWANNIVEVWKSIEIWEGAWNRGIYTWIQ